MSASTSASTASAGTMSSGTVPTSYVPAPVAFVSGDDDDYSGDMGYDAGDGSGGPGGSAGAVTRPEIPRSAPDRSFDSSAPRRRPVVFEEEDDLDVPDFLK
jgi:hypothetical protein